MIKSHFYMELLWRRSMFLSGMQAPRICFLNPIETLFFFEHLTFQEFSESGWQLFSQILVGGWPTPLKNMKVKWDDSSQLNGTIKAMFQTTNQMALPWRCIQHTWVMKICQLWGQLISQHWWADGSWLIIHGYSFGLGIRGIFDMIGGWDCIVVAIVTV